MLKGQAVQAVGAMSGTSLDGVDVAQITTDGVTISGFGPSAYREYSAAERAMLRSGLGQWPDQVSDALVELIETVHADALQAFDEAEIIGFHGQTLAHDPKNKGTHQAGDGQILADVLQKPVVWDFRSADVKLGGEGAPLAPFYHFALAKYIKADAPLAMLNLGGVGNITWIDPRFEKPEEPGALLAFDTGPANAPLNDLMQDRLGQSFDAEGALARTGQVSDEILGAFLADPYFYRMAPKSLDRDTFGDLSHAVKDLNDADAAATLTACIAASVVSGIDLCPAPPSRVLVTGGGRKNTTLMDMLRAGLGLPVDPIETAGLDGDMLEAQAFAYLAVRVVNGLPTSCPSTTGVGAAVGGGTLSTPRD
ncbi:anhydro-N-acetylmuramic acid kinase [Aestuariibius sp. HNIBRBA575]|uniref:anhydro-N-acetylmuramic acid kinase n=1 Tax=Aestuariibius sp. HNIBRBA575 TaxID=3233343 RepID=UPI0034A540C5